jgi:hypothetical protein
MLSFNQYIAEQAEINEFKTREFKVPVQNMPDLEFKIESLNKKAAKLGTKPNEIILGPIVSKQINKGKRHSDGTPEPAKYRDYQMLRVVGEIPVLAGGWSFVGKLEPHEAGVIIKAVPGQKIPPRYRKVNGNECEHCKQKRGRKDSFIVKKGGSYKQVGRSCLKDFLGHLSPEQYAAYAELLHSFEGSMSEYEGEIGGRSYNNSYGNVAAIASAIAAINRNGFVGTQYDDNKESTKYTMIKHFEPPIGAAGKYHVPLSVGEEEIKMAEDALEWIREQAKKNKEEFWYNLGKLASVNTSETKYFGYLAAAALQYLKHVDAIKAKQGVMVGLKDEPLGEEGNKVKYNATIISAFKYSRPSYSYYDSGVSVVLTLKTDSGHLVKMFSTNTDFKKGDTIEVSGKIGKAESEKYDNSPFKGKIVTMMQPRTRLTLIKTADELKDQAAK